MSDRRRRGPRGLPAAGPQLRSQANLSRRCPARAVGILRNDRTDEEELAEVARDRERPAHALRRRPRRHLRPDRVRRPGPHPGAPAGAQRGAGRLRVPEPRSRRRRFAPCAAVLLDFGTEEQKRQHIPAILKGEEIWMQFLSEPSGGSDVAGALTTAVRDGDEWVLNGSKVWTTGAWWSDWGLCLARTNWDVPKHRGLTVFMLPDPPGRHRGPPHRDAQRLQGVLPGVPDRRARARHATASARSTTAGPSAPGGCSTSGCCTTRRSSPCRPATLHAGVGGASMLDVARDAGRLDDPLARDLDRRGPDARAGRRRASGAGSARASRPGRCPTRRRPSAGCSAASPSARRTTIAFELAGAAGAAWTDDDGDLAERGNDFLMRQVGCIGGGTTEMARNVISERVLGMPRERTLDRDVAFRDVPRSASHS